MHEIVDIRSTPRVFNFKIYVFHMSNFIHIILFSIASISKLENCCICIVVTKHNFQTTWKKTHFANHLSEGPTDLIYLVLQ